MTDINNDTSAFDSEAKPLMTNRTYDLAKRFITMVLPAFGTFYVTLANLAGWPGAEVVAGVVLALATFLGVMLNWAGAQYASSDAKYDGVINVTQDPESGLKRADLVLKNYEDPSDVVKQDEVTFKVLGK